MDDYIVRIHRREAESLIGVVEVIESEERYAFHNRDELWSVITGGQVQVFGDELAVDAGSSEKK